MKDTRELKVGDLLKVSCPGNVYDQSVALVIDTTHFYGTDLLVLWVNGEKVFCDTQLEVFCTDEGQALMTLALRGFHDYVYR